MTGASERLRPDRNRTGGREARIAWLAILLSTTAIILALMHALGEFVLSVVARLLAV